MRSHALEQLQRVRQVSMKDFPPSGSGPSPLPDGHTPMPERPTVAEAIERFPRLVIIGEPRSGKTTAHI